MDKLIKAIIDDLLTPVNLTSFIVEATIERLDGRYGWKLVPVKPTKEMKGKDDD